MKRCNCEELRIRLWMAIRKLPRGGHEENLFRVEVFCNGQARIREKHYHECMTEEERQHAAIDEIPHRVIALPEVRQDAGSQTERKPVDGGVEVKETHAALRSLYSAYRRAVNAIMGRRTR